MFIAVVLLLVAVAVAFVVIVNFAGVVYFMLLLALR